MRQRAKVIIWRRKWIAQLAAGRLGADLLLLLFLLVEMSRPFARLEANASAPRLTGQLTTGAGVTFRFASGGASHSN